MKAIPALLGYLVAVLLMMLGSAAVAGPVCVPTYEQVLEPLADRYGERPIWRGVTNLGAVDEFGVILFGALDGSTWTVIAHVANGPWCIVQDGDAWHLPDAALVPLGEEG